MIFKQYMDIIRGLKTQTRRVSTKDTYKVGSVQSVVPKRAKSTVYYRWIDGKLDIWHEHYSQSTPKPLPFDCVDAGGEWIPLKVLILAKHWDPLQSITEEDAMAEGIKAVAGHDVNGQPLMLFSHDLTRIVFFRAVDAYQDLWDIINGKTKFRWDNNPQVNIHRFELVVPERTLI